MNDNSNKENLQVGEISELINDNFKAFQSSKNLCLITK